MIDQYQVIRELGRGGVGVVYLVRHTILGREDALKILLPQYADDDFLKRVMLDDAAIAARLQHDNIVTVHNVGTHEGRPYFVMERLRGEWLDQRIAKGPLPSAKVVAVVRELARALDHAHATGIVHLDVKPHNINLGEDGRIKLTDFGIARHFRGEKAVQQSGMSGTAAYMAPEQFTPETHDIGATADVYALGAVLYEMLTGVQPFRVDDHNLWVLKRMHATAPRPRPSAALPRLGQRFDAPIAKAMAIAPAGRYPSAGEMAGDIARVEQQRTGSFAVRMPGQGGADRPPEDFPARPWLQRSGASVLAVACVVGIVGLVWLMSMVQGGGTGTAEGGGVAAASRPAETLPVGGKPQPTPGRATTAADTNPVFEGAFPTDTPFAVVTLTPASTATVQPGETSPTPRSLPTSVPAGGTITLESPTGLQSDCRVTLGWTPSREADVVLVCAGQHCSPERGIYRGKGPFVWEPAKEVAGQSFADAQGTLRWQVRSADGTSSVIGSFEWTGGACEVPGSGSSGSDRSSGSSGGNR